MHAFVVCREETKIIMKLFGRWDGMASYQGRNLDEHRYECVISSMHLMRPLETFGKQDETAN